MYIPLPEKLNTLAKNCPFPLYLVGGAVRDCLAGLSGGSGDLDICAPVTADKFCEVARRSGAEISAIYRNTGTVKLKLGEEEYEFASFRSDEYVRGIHSPVNTFFTDDICLDARRRDFKCNAVYYDISAGQIVDPLGGARDIAAKRITTVAPAAKVFGEDGLRLMRLARQAAQTGFTPDGECIAGARENRSLISDVSPERIYAELCAILCADGKHGLARAHYRGLKILDTTGVIDVILPELSRCRGLEQRKDYHKYDVFEHSLRAAMYAEKSVRLAALLHDTGKAVTAAERGNFHGHETESAAIARRALERLKAPKKQTEFAERLCALHMYDLRCDARENKIRAFIVDNYDIIDGILAIKQADFSACRDDEGEAPCVTKWKRIISDMKEEGAPFTLKQLAVRGNELIEAGISPDEVGITLKKLLKECAYNPALNTRGKLLGTALKISGADKKGGDKNG